jgi:hypothetical protein
MTRDKPRVEAYLKQKIEEMMATNQLQSHPWEREQLAYLQIGPGGGRQAISRVSQAFAVV